jgi:hypothetical protein
MKGNIGGYKVQWQLSKEAASVEGACRIEIQEAKGEWTLRQHTDPLRVGVYIKKRKKENASEYDEQANAKER